MAAVRADVEALAAMRRGSASPGERRSAQWAAQRLREAGAADVALEAFSFQGTYAGAQAAHAAAGLVAARRGGWRGAALAGAALASFEGEVSGRAQWLRRLLPSSEGVNAVARIPAAGERRSTLVLLAHHDAARTGLSWHPRLLRLGAGAARRSRRMAPRAAPVGLGLALAALPFAPARRAAGALLGLALLSYADIASSPTVPGANDNATGVAAALALAAALAAAPLEHVEVRIVIAGCEESGMGGTAAWLARHGDALDPACTFVLGLDTLGSGAPIVCASEATLFEHRYREEDLALVEQAALRAGIDPPERWRVGAWTDPVLARFAGLPAVSLLSVDEHGGYANWHWPTDTPEHVDWGSVERCLALAGAIADELARRLQVPQEPENSG